MIGKERAKTLQALNLWEKTYEEVFGRFLSPAAAVTPGASSRSCSPPPASSRGKSSAGRGDSSRFAKDRSEGTRKEELQEAEEEIKKLRAELSQSRRSKSRKNRETKWSGSNEEMVGEEAGYLSGWTTDPDLSS